MPQAAGDLVRVEIPHIRFLRRGSSVRPMGNPADHFEAQCVLVCGPSFRTGSVEVSDDTLIIGASLTPAGWHRILGIPADSFANRKADIREIRETPGIDILLETLADETADEILFAAIETYLTGALLEDVRVRDDFLGPALDWVSDPESPGIDALAEGTGLSARQVDDISRYCLIG